MAKIETIGIVGGGQLAQMLTNAALPLGFKVIVINPTQNGPAAQVGAEEIVADLYDPAALHQLAEQSDVITIEIEHLDAKKLSNLTQEGSNVHPDPSTISMTQDKFAQKQHLKKYNVPIASFVEINNREEALAAQKEFTQIILKTKHGAYDGRGNMLVDSMSDIDEALVAFKKKELYAEKVVAFKKELAIMVTRTSDGKISLFPVVETVHKRNICVEVIAPADISDDVATKAKDAATKAISHLDGVGVFGVEMFLDENDNILINEIAPRVHNSGHYTIEGTEVSQFEQHIRAITGLPLRGSIMKVGAAVTVNILGERNGKTIIQGVDEAERIPGVSVHIYGKSPTKIDRKMGHITATAKIPADALANARNARKLIEV